MTDRTNKPDEKIVSHYGGAELFRKIVDTLEASGVKLGEISEQHLKSIDEFHIGGEEATISLLDQLGLKDGVKVLDVGAGIGGPARLMTARYGADVTGLDLTPDFIETAKQLTGLLSLPTQFKVGSALDLPFDDNSFDVATLLHVGMNLPDKDRLFDEVWRVLKPQGRFAVYDVMRFGAAPAFPLPWASDPAASFLASPDVYLDAADKAGFELEARRDRGEVAKEFFAALREKIKASGPPVLGLPMLMGMDAADKVANMTNAVGAGDIAPVEMIFKKRD
ncbi:Demethylrebeccamycin-D-glucose O-methyltransferase [Falsiruegeria litorea R37]|uniref:Demethylrebeccamycin-D-glucose O-methyltransferase n=1 Tax=Falsiruegeria litorea R37 TaxID=1200284 RepID=A0A1Y5SRY2_9RHOB|nr:class I SAM-dependent methyltransferase [Falsiruegeria litorea]SLN47054.1 Demethylrebeccamycin-D-glucose O-methyltransferase [Falsiruegeria litorea R37]